MGIDLLRPRHDARRANADKARPAAQNDHVAYRFRCHRRHSRAAIADHRRAYWKETRDADSGTRADRDSDRKASRGGAAMKKASAIVALILLGCALPAQAQPFDNKGSGVCGASVSDRAGLFVE